LIAGLNLDKLNNIIKNKAMKIKNKILKIITMSKAELTYETYDMNTRYV